MPFVTLKKRKEKNIFVYINESNAIRGKQLPSCKTWTWACGSYPCNITEALFTFLKEHGCALTYSFLPRPPPADLTTRVREVWVEARPIRDWLIHSMGDGPWWFPWKSSAVVRSLSELRKLTRLWIYALSEVLSDSIIQYCKRKDLKDEG